MTGNEVHPLVTLLTERMKSHPEEFKGHFVGEPERAVASDCDRWGYAINEIQRYGSDTDNEALIEGLRPIRLDKAHQWALNELLNGAERRAQEKREREEATKQNAQRLMNGLFVGGGGGGGGGGSSGVSSNPQFPTWTTAKAIQIGNETIDEGFLNTVKKKLGI